MSLNRFITKIYDVINLVMLISCIINFNIFYILYILVKVEIFWLFSSKIKDGDLR